MYADQLRNGITILLIVVSSQCVEKPDPVDAPINIPTVESVSFPALSDFRATFGAPHILEDGICYYMGRWHTGGTFMMLMFIEDTIIASQTLSYNQDTLYTYIPHLIESLENADKAVTQQALDFLTDVMRQLYNTTSDADKDTPFEKYPSVWHEKAYQDWQTWWDREGEKDFVRMQPDVQSITQK